MRITQRKSPQELIPFLHLNVTNKTKKRFRFTTFSFPAQKPIDLKSLWINYEVRNYSFYGCEGVESERWVYHVLSFADTGWNYLYKLLIPEREPNTVHVEIVLPEKKEYYQDYEFILNANLDRIISYMNDNPAHEFDNYFVSNNLI